MKVLFTILLLLFTFITTYAQEIYIDDKTLDTCLFLGGINTDNDKELKVIENGKIVFKNFDNLTQIGLLIGKEFTDEVFKQGLCFELNGYEPFWNIKLLKDKIIVWDMETGERIEYTVNLHTDLHTLTSVFYAMFSVNDFSIYGTINNIGFWPNSKCQCICEYDIPEKENPLFEAYVYIKGRVYKGCVTINKFE